MKDFRNFINQQLAISQMGYISVERNSNHTFDVRHGKTVNTFSWIEHGSVEFLLTDARKITINKGDLLFIPKQVPYKIRYLQDNTLVKCLQFDIAGNNDSLNTFRVKKSARISEIISSLKSEKINDFLLCSIIFKLLYIVSDEEEVVPQRFRKIAAVVNDLENNYQENRKVSYYAALSGMCESNFRRLFKEYTGKSLIEYRNEIRLNNVNKMLISGEYKVSEAAYQAGFNNMAFFYELYRKYNKQK